MLQSLDGRAIRVDEAGKGGRPRGGFQSGQRGGRFSGSRGRGGRGYSRGENLLSCVKTTFVLCIFDPPLCFSFVFLVLSLEAEDMVATGAMETEVMVKGALGVVIGALVVVVVDTEVADILLAATETTGKNFVANLSAPPSNKHTHTPLHLFGTLSH